MRLLPLKSLCKKFLLILAIIIFLGLVSSTLVLGTKSGRDYLLQLVCRITASESFSLKLTNLDLGKTWSLEYLALGDQDGLWLELEQISLAPQFLPLLRGRIHLDQVGAKHIALHRLPVSDNATSSSSASSLYLPPVTILSLNLDHILLDEAALGQRAELGIHGHLSMDTSTAQGALDVVHFHRSQDRIALHGVFHPQKQRLMLDLEGHEEPGGLIAHIMGLEDGLSIKILGDGPLASWPLNIQLDLPDLAKTSAQATLNLHDLPHQSQIQGKILLGQTGLGFLPLPDPEISFFGEGSLSSGQILAAANINTGAGQLDVNATWTQKSQELATFFQIKSGDLSTLLPPDIKSGATALHGKIGLVADKMDITTELLASNWTLGDIPLEHLKTQAHITKPLDENSWQSHLTLTAFCPDFDQGLTHWNATLDIGGKDNAIHIQQCLVESAALSLDFRATLDEILEAQAILKACDLKINDVPFSGQVSSQLKGGLDLQTPGFVGQLQIQSQNLVGLPPVLDQILGSRLTLTSDLQVSQELIQIQDFTLGPNLCFKADAEIKPLTQSFTSKFSATIPKIDLEQAHLAAGTTLEGKVQGSFSSFDLDIKGQIKNLIAQDVHLGPTALTATIQDLPSGPQAVLAMHSTLNQEPLSLALEANTQENTLTIAKARMALPQSALDLEGNLSLENFLFNGQSRFSSDDLSDLGRILGLSLSGALTMNTNIFDRQSVQAASLMGQGKNLSIADLEVQDLTLESELNLLDPLQDLTLTVQCNSAGPSALVLDFVQLKALALDRKLTLDLAAHQEATQTAVTSQALVDMKQEQTQISLHRLDGTLLNQKLALTAPTSITLGTDKTQWSKAHLTFGPATVSLTGLIDAYQSNIEVTLDQANTGQLAHFFPDLPEANLASELKITGAHDNPTMDLNFRMQNIKAQGWELTGLPALHAQASARVHAGQFTAKAKVYEDQHQSLVQATLACPLHINLLAPVPPPSTTPIIGELLAHTNLNLLPQLLFLDDQIMAGKTTAQITLGGTLETPTMVGTAQVDQGRYENFRTGTRLENIDLKATAHGTDLDVQITAQDGYEGKLLATATATQGSLKAGLDVQNMRLLDSDLIQSTAQGKITLTLDETQSNIQGNLVFDPTQVRLPASMPADLVLLDIEEINSPAIQDKKEAAPPLPDIKLNLGLQFPARLFVRGRGLDSEWSGNLNITQTPANPRMVGQMELLRGKFDFLDRTFALTKGNILLNGENPPNPYLDIMGEVQVMDTTILVHIHGPGKNFQVALSSLPVLPQDELLSLILFGRSIQQISPFQAVRLAQAAATLAGVGGDLDFFNSIKSTLGLQEIEISNDSDNNTSVGLGGYVGGKYYVRTQRSVSGQDKTRVEIQLTPKISVETEIGGDSHQGGGVNWKQDY